MSSNKIQSQPFITHPSIPSVGKAPTAEEPGVRPATDSAMGP